MPRFDRRRRSARCRHPVWAAEATAVLGAAHEEWGDDFRRLAATVSGHAAPARGAGDGAVGQRCSRSPRSSLARRRAWYWPKSAGSPMTSPLRQLGDGRPRRHCRRRRRGTGDAAGGRGRRRRTCFHRGGDFGSAVKIMTGATIPEGADAVVPVEVTCQEGDRVEIREAVPMSLGSGPPGDVAVGPRCCAPGSGWVRSPCGPRLDRGGSGQDTPPPQGGDHVDRRRAEASGHRRARSRSDPRHQPTPRSPRCYPSWASRCSI